MVLVLAVAAPGCGASNAQTGAPSVGAGSSSVGSAGSIEEVGGAGSSAGNSAGNSASAGQSASSAGSAGSAGAKSTGGSAGAAPEPPPPRPTVQPCSSVSSASGWEKITPPGDLGDAQALGLDPLNVGTIYVQMHKGGNGAHSSTDGLYMSDNCGSTWKRVPQGRGTSDPGTNINTGSLVALIIDPVDSKVMYTASNYGPGGIWKSVNGGVDFEQVVPESVGKYVNQMWFSSLDMEPTNHKHLAAANHANCNGPHSPNCIAETRDAGLTWTLIPAPVGWAEGNGVSVLGDQTLLFVTNMSGMYLTKDDGANWTRVGDGANGPGQGFPMYKATDGTYYLASSYGLISSKDLTKWTNVKGGLYRSMAGTGQNIIISGFYEFNYQTASMGALASDKWSTLGADSAPKGGNGGVWLTYEAEHHLLYSSNFDVGLWRIVTN